VYRVFAGYVGWAPQQLADETARGDWQVLPANEQVLFLSDLDGLWNELAHRQELPVR
jgi:putative transcriptional regulator